MALAGSKQRLSGHSKKAQYGAFTGYVLVVLAMLLGIVLLVISLIQPASFDGLRGLFSDATRPAAQVSATTRTGGRGFFESVQGYLEAGQQNADLKREVEIARIRLAEARATEEENRRLKGLLGLRETEVEPVAAAPRRLKQFEHATLRLSRRRTLRRGAPRHARSIRTRDRGPGARIGAPFLARAAHHG